MIQLHSSTLSVWISHRLLLLLVPLSAPVRFPHGWRRAGYSWHLSCLCASTLLPLLLPCPWAFLPVPLNHSQGRPASPVSGWPTHPRSKCQYSTETIWETEPLSHQSQLPSLWWGMSFLEKSPANQTSCRWEAQADPEAMHPQTHFPKWVNVFPGSREKILETSPRPGLIILKKIVQEI